MESYRTDMGAAEVQPGVYPPPADRVKCMHATLLKQACTYFDDTLSGFQTALEEGCGRTCLLLHQDPLADRLL